MVPGPQYLFSIMIMIGLVACKPGNRGSIEKEVIPGTEITQDPIPEKVDQNKYIITDSSAGPFRIGSQLPGPVTMMKYQMRVEQITRQTEEGPVTESVTIIAENNEDLLWLKPGLLAGDQNQDPTIYEIIILSPKYRTKDNIGIGSSIFDFKKAYPDHRVWYTYVNDMFVLETDTIKAQFILDKNDYTGPEIEYESEITPLLTSDFKHSGRIKRIRLLRTSTS